jgi:molybdate transport system substrate-binding protein
VLGFSAKRVEGSALAVLQERDFESIGMANPDLAPYGRAAVEVLEALGIRTSLKEKMVYGQNVGQVLTYLSRGEIESAFLPRTLADSQGCAYLEIPPTLYSPLEQVMVVPLSGLNPSGGREFAEYILGSEGRKILSRHGFALPDRRAADDS